MRILLINTSEPEALVALARDGKVIAERLWMADTTLGSKLLFFLDELLQEAHWQRDEVQRVAVHRGPGHYSALRTGIVTATMLAYGTQLALVSVGGNNLSQQIKEAEVASPELVIMPVYK